MNTLIIPQWPAPDGVKAVVTTRQGGVSQTPYASFNLGAHVNDDLLDVQSNRQQCLDFLPELPLWLNQVHGKQVFKIERSVLFEYSTIGPQADAIWTDQKNKVCAVLTADCLPVICCDTQGCAVAAIHAGWRGLAAGIIEQTILDMDISPQRILVWLGPAIGPQAFEVGEEVRQLFMQTNRLNQQAFRATENPTKWLADLYLLAKIALKQIGVQAIYGGDLCTYRDKQRFYSYRRDGQTGRFMTAIWLST